MKTGRLRVDTIDVRVALGLLAASVAGCASTPGAAPKSSAAPQTPTAAAPGAAASTSAPAVDPSNEDHFTSSVLARLQHDEPNGGWALSEPLTLHNTTGLQVNLDRIWNGCSHDREGCQANVDHFVGEVLKVASQKAPDAPPTIAQIMPVLRPLAWVKSLPAEMQTDSVYEPFLADLVWVYVIDEGGSVRGVMHRDVEALGVSRQSLEESAKKNLAATLHAPTEPIDCSAHQVQLLNTNDYYESSRLLLNDFWSDLAHRSHGSLYVAVPTPDVLLVTCDPAKAVLEGLPAVVAKVYAEAERPISRSLFKWSPHGWQEVAPSKMATH